MKSKSSALPIIIAFFLVYSGCKSTSIQDTVLNANQLVETVTTSSPAVVNQECAQPPSNLPTKFEAYIRPNCFKNIERLGKWTGGTTQVGRTEDPSKYFASVETNSIGNSEKPVHVYIVAHGWAPGSRKEFNAAGGQLKWWSSEASYKEQDDQVWQSYWAWTGTEGTQGEDLEISPTGLLQTIQEYANKANSEAETVILAYSWMDNSATVSIGMAWNSWAAASRSESYTNLNGMRLADAIQQATTDDFFTNPQNKLHLIGHSHGSKVMTVASLELQKQNLPVQQLSIFDSPENAMTYTSNSANLLGFYLDHMTIAPPSSVLNHESLFVESYVSMFGNGYTGKEGSNINHVAQVGLDSDGVFKTVDAGARHSYAATWYTNAWNVSNSKKYPILGFGWPAAKGQSEFKNSYYQGMTDKTSTAWDEDQWKLATGSISKGDISYQYSYYENPAIDIQQISTSGNVSGNLDEMMVFEQSNEGANTPAHFTGSFKANTESLYGLSFNMRWDNAKAGDYVIVTVQAPEAKNTEDDQIIALVFDHTAALKNETWHPVAFNTYSLGRENTVFNVYYYPNPAISDHPGKLHIKDFGYVKETYDLD